MAIPTRYRCPARRYLLQRPGYHHRYEVYLFDPLAASGMEKIRRKSRCTAGMDELGEMLSRFVVGQAKDLQVDGSGRILFPTELRGYAELEKKLVLVGRTQRLEIWSEDNWNAEREKSQENYRGMLIDKDNMSDALKNLSW